jgi:hypothetical protein
MSTKNEKIGNKVEQLLAERDEVMRPIWVRAPRPGEYERFTSLGRGKMYQAEKDGHVKTATLKPPGAVRGVKLFNLQSLLRYVESCVNMPAPEKSSASK